MNFLITSNSKDNFDFAKKYKIWQTKKSFTKVKEGDLAFIKNSGDPNIEFFGVIEKIGQEPTLKWPDGEYVNETEFTVRVRDITTSDFKGIQLAIKEYEYNK